MWPTVTLETIAMHYCNEEDQLGRGAASGRGHLFHQHAPETHTYPQGRVWNLGDINCQELQQQRGGGGGLLPAAGIFPSAPPQLFHLRAELVVTFYLPLLPHPPPFPPQNSSNPSIVSHLGTVIYCCLCIPHTCKWFSCSRSSHFRVRFSSVARDHWCLRMSL